jgi:hypothetical protein
VRHGYNQFVAALASLVIVSACGQATSGTNQASPSPTASPTPVSTPTPSDQACPSQSPPPNSGFATYSFNRITIQYPPSWRLQPPYSGGSIFWLYSPDYKDSGGAEIQTIQLGARMVFSQTDLPRKDITADNYPTSNRAGYVDGKVVVLSCRKAFQLRQANPPWFDSSSTVLFRDDGTEVEAQLMYPSGHPAPHASEYASCLHHSSTSEESSGGPSPEFTNPPEVFSGRAIRWTETAS